MPQLAQTRSLNNYTTSNKYVSPTSQCNTGRPRPQSLERFLNNVLHRFNDSYVRSLKTNFNVIVEMYGMNFQNFGSVFL